MRNNSRIHRPNVVTRRAATEQMGAFNRFGGVCPNNNNDSNKNNNNSHTALAKCF